MPLADLQAGIRRAILDGDVAAVAFALVGGRRPAARLAVHQRHYGASLGRALASKFPGVQWLIGGPAFVRAVAAFVARFPPRAPCIAEYGDEFPAFLGETLGQRIPYLAAFARLERLVGCVAIAIEHEPLAVAALLNGTADRLGDVRLTLQPGLGYVAADHAIDGLMRAFVSDAVPEQFALAAEPVHLEVRGARGRFAFRRMAPGAFAFREAIEAGAPLGVAAEAAAGVDAAFDPSPAIASLFTEGLVTAVV